MTWQMQVNFKELNYCGPHPNLYRMNKKNSSFRCVYVLLKTWIFTSCQDCKEICTKKGAVRAKLLFRFLNLLTFLTFSFGSWWRRNVGLLHNCSTFIIIILLSEKQRAEFCFVLKSCHQSGGSLAAAICLYILAKKSPWNYLSMK